MDSNLESVEVVFRWDERTDFGVTWPELEKRATWRLGGVAGHCGLGDILGSL